MIFALSGRSAADVCGPGRNAGKPTPSWWTKVRPVVVRNLSYFPRGVPISFIGAWIEQETDGRYWLSTKYAEVGYFQLHPDEIGALIDHRSGNIDKTTAPWSIIGPVAPIAEQIKSDPDVSMQWGGRLLSYYDQQLAGVGVPRGTDLYYGLLKAMHWSPWARIWAIHVRHALGRWPRTYAEFDGAAKKIMAGSLPWDPSTKRASSLPSCSPLTVLDRVPSFKHPDDATVAGTLPIMRVIADRYRRPLWFVPLPMPLRMRSTMLGGALGTSSSFPGIRFSKPLRGHILAKGGWGDSRPSAKSGFHAGVDIYRPKGDPVYAMAPGEVYVATKKGQAGNWVGIEHKNGWISRYMHLNERFVEKGEHVKRGQRIGTVGQTGFDPTRAAPHLHLSVLLDRTKLPEFQARYGKSSPAEYPMLSRKGIQYTAIPLEPVVPIDEYSARMAKRMASRNVMPYQGSPPVSANWPAFFAIGAIGVLGLIAAFAFWPARLRA